MIYLDTHVLIWLYSGPKSKLSDAVRSIINESDPLISPMVMLELGYMRDIGRFDGSPDDILSDLSRRFGLRLCQEPFAFVVHAAMVQTWTRDPFDRIIVGHAAVRQSRLITKDHVIRANYPHAFWSDE